MQGCQYPPTFRSTRRCQVLLNALTSNLKWKKVVFVNRRFFEKSTMHLWFTKKTILILKYLLRYYGIPGISVYQKSEIKLFFSMKFFSYSSQILKVEKYLQKFLLISSPKNWQIWTWNLPSKPLTSDVAFSQRYRYV